MDDLVRVTNTADEGNRHDRIMKPGHGDKSSRKMLSNKTCHLSAVGPRVCYIRASAICTGKADLHTAVGALGEVSWWW